MTKDLNHLKRHPDFGGCPWVTDRLTMPDRDEAIEATRAFACWLFQKVPISFDHEAVYRAVEEFTARLEASTRVAGLLRFEVPLKPIAWMLERLAFAEALRLQGIRLATTTEADDDPSDSRPTGEIKRILGDANRLVRRMPPGPRRERMKKAVDAELQPEITSFLIRSYAAMTRRRPDRSRPQSPVRWIAENIDGICSDLSDRERDRLIADLSTEVLGIQTQPDQVRELMKAYRRQRRSAAGASARD